MLIHRLHDFNLTTRQAIELQENLASRVLRVSRVPACPHLIAGVDMSVNRLKNTAEAAVVVLRYPGLEVVETRVVHGKPEFPYVPGLLSFRELPLTISAFEQLSQLPDLVIVDAQGIAHPRRIGFASHLGLFLDVPTIGCAKSLLCGTYNTPGEEKGSFSEITEQGEVIGAAVRTRSKTKSVFVSIGHMIDLTSAIHWVLGCSCGFRLPEPTRLAHIASRGGQIPRSSRIKHIEEGVLVHTNAGTAG